MATFTLQKSIAAPIEVVFDVLTDHRGYAKITPLRSSTLESEGDPAPNGVGAIRSLHLVGPPIRERVTAFDRPGMFAYEMVSGVPASKHTGTVRLTSQSAGTALDWQVESIPKIPVPAAVWSALVRPVINQLLKGVVKESERRAASS